MSRLRWALLAALALSLAVGPAAVADPLIADPANETGRSTP